jgi:hypothetical protein
MICVILRIAAVIVSSILYFFTLHEPYETDFFCNKVIPNDHDAW